MNNENQSEDTKRETCGHAANPPSLPGTGPPQRYTSAFIYLFVMTSYKRPRKKAVDNAPILHCEGRQVFISLNNGVT